MDRTRCAGVIAVLVLLGLAALPVSAAPPPGSTFVASGTGPSMGYYQIYCQPDGQIYIQGTAMSVSIGGGMPSTWPPGPIASMTGPSPANVTIHDMSATEVYNATVTCTGGSAPASGALTSVQLASWPQDPPGVNRILGGRDDAGSPIVGFVRDHLPTVFSLYFHDGQAIGDINLNSVGALSPGQMVSVFTAPDGTEVRVYYLGQIDGKTVLQINHYQPDGTYTERTARAPGLPTDLFQMMVVQDIASVMPWWLNYSEAFNIVGRATSGIPSNLWADPDWSGRAERAAIEAYTREIMEGNGAEQAQYKANAAALTILGANPALVQAAANGADLNRIQQDIGRVLGPYRLLRQSIYADNAAYATALHAYCTALNNGDSPELALAKAREVGLNALGIDPMFATVPGE